MLGSHPQTHACLFGTQEAEDEKSVLMAAVQSGGEEANLLLPELGTAFYDMTRWVQWGKTEGGGKKSLGKDIHVNSHRALSLASPFLASVKKRRHRCG